MTCTGPSHDDGAPGSRDAAIGAFAAELQAEAAADPGLEGATLILDTGERIDLRVDRDSMCPS